MKMSKPLSSSQEVTAYCLKELSRRIHVSSNIFIQQNEVLTSLQEKPNLVSLAFSDMS